MTSNEVGQDYLQPIIMKDLNRINKPMSTDSHPAVDKGLQMGIAQFTETQKTQLKVFQNLTCNKSGVIIGSYKQKRPLNYSVST